MKKIVFLLLFIYTNVSAQELQKDVLKQLKMHVEYLSSDMMQGRNTGSMEAEKAARYIAAQFYMHGLTPIDSDKTYFQRFDCKVKKNPHGDMSKEDIALQAINVVGFIDNKKENTIIIGAHYDHLGHGEYGGSLSVDTKDLIHNGADDNASGVAGLIELAAALKNYPEANYNFLFIAFSGEELGLYGSNYFTKNPLIDMKKTNLMINMDMIGRLKESTLIINGVGTNPDLNTLLQSISIDDVKYKLSESGVGPSDHTSFYFQDIPVLHFFTGAHEDYHKPTDDFTKINYRGMISILNIILDVCDAVNSKPKLTFTKTKEEDDKNSPKFSVTLGVMPDYIYDGAGMKIDGVTEGKPAQKAGLQKGDIVTKLGDIRVKDMQSYMEALSKFKKGDTTQVEVARGGKIVKASITF